MQCECCGREEDVLIEIGAVSPMVSVTGRCCADCCAFILRALEDRREEQPAERAEMVPVQDGQVFVDEDGCEISPEEIRFGMKDIAGRIHYFCMRDLHVIPEYEAFEIYPKGLKPSSDPERAAYRGMKLIQRLEKLETDDDDFPEYQIGMIRDLIADY